MKRSFSLGLAIAALAVLGVEANASAQDRVRDPNAKQGANGNTNELITSRTPQSERGASFSADATTAPTEQRRSYGYFIAPEMRATTLASSAALLVGLQGGWILNHRLVVGAAGYGLVNDVASPAQLQSDLHDATLRMGYGGGRVGGMYEAWRVLHLTYGVLGGAGAMTTQAPDPSIARLIGFMVIEPDVGAELNIADPIRLALGGSFRFVTADLVGASRLSGPAVTVAIKYGAF